MSRATDSIPDIGFRRRETPPFGVELVDLHILQHQACTYTNPPDCPHRILFHCFCFPHYDGIHEIDFQKVPFNPTDVVYIGSGQVHAWDMHQPMSGFALLLEEDFINKITPLLPTHLLFELRYNKSVHCDSKVSELITKILNLLQHELQTNVARKEIELLVAHLLRVIAPNKNEDAIPKDLEQFRRFCELVEKNCAQTRHVGFYADRLNMTTETLNRLVRKMSAVSAKRWIDRCVVLLAQRRLVSEKISIERLSSDMGFTQPTHFVKFFSRLSGETPGNFQRGKR